MTTTRPIQELASDLGISEDCLLPYGQDKAKIRLEATAQSPRSPGKLILVSAMTPTGAGEGKTTVSIGLSQGLARLGERVCLTLREPSLGPTFGMKGGATGGGRSTLVPAEDINLHFTGDFHAITSAHNLLAALLDNHLHRDRPPHLDPRHILWPRVMDLNDRSLRHLVMGLGGPLQGVPRETGFEITPASEVMAALCLAEDYDDLRGRLERLIIAEARDGQPFTAGDLGAVGAMMTLLRDAMLPNLVQTVEGVPALIHGGPFANIAHGCNSIVATRMAMAHADWTVTEAGFGFDLGGEKFFDIKCATAGLDPAAVVLVATVRALKRHGGVARNKLEQTDPAAVERGLGNLGRHIESVKTFGKTPIVAINRFDPDSEEEIQVIRRACEKHGVACAVTELFQRGGEGAVELAETVLHHARQPTARFDPLYTWSEPVKAKLHRVASAMYGASLVTYESPAERDIERIDRLGYSGLPLCVAKTPLSFTGDATVVGRPEDFELKIRRVLLSAGAGYLVPLVGDIVRMPGLPAAPQATHMDLVDGEIRGLL
ncbi:MAG: formate--tetrahydrofolate ligase [Gammaproteobacteria bacterium]